MSHSTSIVDSCDNPENESQTSNPSLESLMELVCSRKWQRARELIEGDSESLYVKSGNRNGGLVIHEVCEKVSFPSSHANFSDEISDDEDDEGGEENTCALEENQQMCNFARYMIAKSHAMGPILISSLPEQDNDASEEIDDHGALGPSQLHESILTVTDTNGKTPLHVLCAHSVDTNMLRAILSSTREYSQNPHAPTSTSLITAKDSNGCTPLHYLAYARQCPISSLELMMDYCRPAFDGTTGINPTTCIDSDGDTPLHWALDGYSSPRRLRQLIRHSKAALWVKNHAGKVPFDQFVANFVEPKWREKQMGGKETWDSIQAYLKVIAGMEDKQEEWMPVHVLAKLPIEFPRVFYEMALHYNKDDVSKPDREGMLPLHLVCARPGPEQSPSSDSFDYLLLKEYPQAAHKAAAGCKRLPLHFALESNKPLQFVASLLKAYPNSLNINDPVTRLWPFVLASVGQDETIDVSYALLRADPSIMQVVISALISKRGQRAAQALRQMDASELEEHASRRLRTGRHNESR